MSEFSVDLGGSLSSLPKTGDKREGPKAGQGEEFMTAYRGSFCRTHLSSQTAFGVIVSGAYIHERESGDTLGLALYRGKQLC